MDFEWDRTKAESNRRKHKVSFDEAVTIFYDPLAATFNDPDHSVQERRQITIGYSSKDRLLVVAHTERGGKVRIINARTATAHERRKHET
ncbi:MAG: BrnT family toxin [Burkholderiales bacterium]|nr:BrnT family toxin [Burkholderiales bacterium]